MFPPEELIRRLKPRLGDQKADRIWKTYLQSDEDERALIQHSLESLYEKLVDDYQDEKILLSPPYTYGQLYGEYNIGTVWYGDRPLYPFALKERELTGHMGVFGMTGAGKSSFVRHLILTHLVFKKPVLIFDWKGTYTDLAGHNLLFFCPGSSSFPFFFNPLNTEGIGPEQHKTYLRQIIELALDSYFESLALLTTSGVEYLLLLALDALLEQKKQVTFQDLFLWIKNFQGRMREMDWKASALNLLYRIISGPLGPVVQKGGMPVAWLFKQRALFELGSVGSSKDRAFFIRALLLRLYYHASGKGPSGSLKLLLVIEEAHNILLKKESGHESVIEVMLRQIREFGVGICLVDQHPSLMSQPALATYTTVAFALKLQADRDAMASALSLENDTYLARLPPRFAIVKIQDRFLTPFMIKTFDVAGQKRRSEEEIKKQMAALLPEKENKTYPVLRDIREGSVVEKVFRNQSRFVEVVRQVAKGRGLSLLWEEVLLVHIYVFPLMGTVERYNHLCINRYQGHKHRTSLLKMGHIRLEETPTKTGRLKVMVPTDAGFCWLAERGFCTGSDKVGGIEHQYWKRRLFAQFKKEGYSVALEVAQKKGGFVDLVVSLDKRKVCVEIETGKNTYQQIFTNIKKSIDHADGVVSFILDPTKEKKVKGQVKEKKAFVVSCEEDCIDAVEKILKRR